MIRRLLEALAARTTFTGRERAGVLCDPNLPPNWHPQAGTVQDEPPPCCGDPAELERIEAVSGTRERHWLEEVPSPALNLPPFLRDHVGPLPDFAPRNRR